MTPHLYRFDKITDSGFAMYQKICCMDGCGADIYWSREYDKFMVDFYKRWLNESFPLNEIYAFFIDHATNLEEI